MAKTPNENAPEDATAKPAASRPITSRAAPARPATARPTAAQPATVQPTEQLAAETPPMSAGEAARAGTTGLDDTSTGTKVPRENETVFRRHPLASGITAGVIAVILVSGLTAWGVGTAVTASLNSQNAQLAPPPTAAPAPATGATPTGGRLAFRATIQSIDDSTWTILTRKGQTVTVTVDGSTQFGTKRVSETAGSFAVGDSVIIIATRSGNAATATRVVNAADVGKGLGAGTRSGAGTGTGSGTSSGTSSGTMAPMPTPTSSATT